MKEQKTDKQINKYNALKLWEHFNEKFADDIRIRERLCGILEAAIDSGAAEVVANVERLLVPYIENNGKREYLPFPYHELVKTGHDQRKQKALHAVIARAQVADMRRAEVQRAYEAFLQETRDYAIAIERNSENLSVLMRKNPIISRYLEPEERTIQIKK